MTDPSQHEVHEVHDLPLAARIVDRIIQEWLDRHTGLALAATGDLNDYERGVRQGINQMRHLHLDNYWYTVTPQIIDELTRAGLVSAPRVS